MVTFLPAAFLGWFAIAAILSGSPAMVPAAMAERLGLVAALRRTVELGRADYVHAAGLPATLAPSSSGRRGSRWAWVS